MMEWRLSNLQGEYKVKTGKTLTIRRIAADTGLSKTTINDLAMGKIHRPDEKTMVALLAYFSKLLGRNLQTHDLWPYMPEATTGDTVTVTDEPTVKINQPDSPNKL